MRKPTRFNADKRSIDQSNFDVSFNDYDEYYDEFEWWEQDYVLQEKNY